MKIPDQTLTKLLSDESFVRWITGKADPAEKREWELWEQQAPLLHGELKSKANLLYMLPLEVTNGADVEEQLSGLEKRINKFPYPSQNRQSKKGYRLAVAAAIILLLAVIGVLSYYYRIQPQTPASQSLYSTIETGYGEMGSLKISDGSSIRLNANSTLRYSPGSFSKARIEVWLQGEAYFSITRNPRDKKRTFIVHTPDGDIGVLGTTFNVNTRFRRTTVVLEEGEIKVSLRDSLQQVVKEKVVKPGERALLASSADTIPVQKVDTSLYTAWRKGKLVFKETTLKEIIRIIESTYGITMNVTDPGLLDEKISGSLRNPDLQTLLKGLEKTLQLNIKKKTEDEFLVSSRQSSGN